MPARRYTLRKAFSVFMQGLCVLSVLIALVPLFLILGYLIQRGLSSLNFDFFVNLPAPVGESGGGMANAIVGTLQLIGMACVFGIPVGVMSGIFLSEYGHQSRWTGLIRFSADILNGVPSIVIGIFIYVLMVQPMRRFSALAGAVALGVMMIPTITRTTEEMLKMVPTVVREGALALGVPRWKTILRVVLRTGMGGIVTGVLLAIARISGETAPLLFTALGNQHWNRSLVEPIAALPLQIFAFAISPYEEWHAQAWTGALVLITIILVLNVSSRMIMKTGPRINQ